MLELAGANQCIHEWRVETGCKWLQVKGEVIYRLWHERISLPHVKTRADSARSENHQQPSFYAGHQWRRILGIIEEIYELEYEGRVPLTPVIFKCHWFDPRRTRRTPHLGLVKIFGNYNLLGVTDKEDKQDISKISNQIQIKFNLNLSKFK